MITNCPLCGNVLIQAKSAIVDGSYYYCTSERYSDIHYGIHISEQMEGVIYLLFIDNLQYYICADKKKNKTSIGGAGWWSNYLYELDGVLNLESKDSCSSLINRIEKLNIFK